MPEWMTNKHNIRSHWKEKALERNDFVLDEQRSNALKKARIGSIVINNNRILIFQSIQRKTIERERNFYIWEMLDTFTSLWI